VYEAGSEEHAAAPPAAASASRIATILMFMSLPSDGAVYSDHTKRPKLGRVDALILRLRPGDLTGVAAAVGVDDGC